jgi:hypothetical protein
VRHDQFILAVAASGAVAWAAVCSASSNAWGNRFPRPAARRKIPAQALALKKYRCGTSPVSKTSDNEHTLPSLWDGTSVAVHSHKLSVQNAVGEPIPEVAQEPEEGTKVPSSA